MLHEVCVMIRLDIHSLALYTCMVVRAVLSNIVLHLHVTYYCYDELCRYMHFTRAKHFVASYMI